MQDLSQEFLNLFSISGFLALINIIVIDIVMSGDNAIVVGMATRNLQAKIRKKAIFVGIGLATIMRIVFALSTTILLEITGLRFAGGLLLLYVVWKFYKELRCGEGYIDEKKVEKENSGFWQAVYTIVLADVSMSLDNVLAVAGASHDNIVILGIGLIFSILLMAFASNLIAKNLNRFPIIQWVGLLVILFVAIEMLIKGTPDIENTIHIYNLFPFFIFLVGIIFLLLHQKFAPISETKIKLFIEDNFLKIIVSFLFIIILFVNLGDTLSKYINHHIAILYFINIIILFVFLEVISIMKSKK